MSTRTRTAVVALVAISLASAACGSRGSTSHASAAGSSSTGSPYLGPVRTTTNYGGDLVLEPPGDAKPALTWEQADAHCAGHGCVAGRGAQISLALATTPRSGTLRPDGSVRPGTDHALSYVLVARNRSCGLPAGPAQGAIDRHDCTFVQLIAANTGVVGYAMSGHVASTTG